MVSVPFAGPVPTFRSLKTSLAEWAAPASAGEALDRARKAIRRNDFTAALAEIAALRTAVQATPAPMTAWRALDLDMLLSKFERRVVTVQAGLLPARRLRR
jgi:hypothetical protein